MNAHTRKQKLAARRKLKARRRFKARYLGEGKVEFTCIGHASAVGDWRTYGCGKTHTKTYPNTGVRGISHRFLEEKLIPYWNHGSIQGTCPHCTRKLREERYPL